MSSVVLSHDSISRRHAAVFHSAQGGIGVAGCCVEAMGVDGEAQ